jgi:hypothetical protein
MVRPFVVVERTASNVKLKITNDRGRAFACGELMDYLALEAEIALPNSRLYALAQP